MISKHELYKIAIASTAMILMLAGIVSSVDALTLENVTINWENATDICQGTPLSYDQLDAWASSSTPASFTIRPGVTGTFFYNPDVGTVLREGQHQPLNVTFVPSASTIYANASKTVYINVIGCEERHGFPHVSEYGTFLPLNWG
jgi:hypothetical protein